MGHKKGRRIVDKTGNQYGRLTVIKQAGMKGASAAWLCRCECGNEKVISGRYLHNGGTRSCGCLRIESGTRAATEARHLPPGEAARNAILSVYRHAAGKRELGWRLAKKQFRELIKQPCYYCGAEPANTHVTPAGDIYVYQGVDRVDNARGYAPDNVVPCCKVCNRAKFQMGPVEFAAWIKQVYNHYARLK